MGAVVLLHHQQRINNTMEENKKVVETIKILATISRAVRISQLHHSNTWVSIHSKRCS